MSTPETDAADRRAVAERFQLKAFVEACLVLEEGIAGVRDIDLGMMMGTGMVPGPFARADFRGLDDVLAAMEEAEDEWGEGFEPPLILRRLVAQGRLGAKSGQGFYPYPQPDAGYEGAPVKLDTRGEVAIVWLDNPPANSISPGRDRGARDGLEGDRGTPATVPRDDRRLAEPGAVLRRRRHQGVHADGRGGRQRAARPRRTGCSASGSSRGSMTIAAVNGLALGGGCELAMACDVRLAAFSATFGQPEINLGIIPGFGGTQRLPRLVGPAKALEMNLTGESISAEDAYEHGLVNRVVADHELFDAAMAWARKFAGQAPVAVEQIKRVSHAGRPRRGHRGREAGVRRRCSRPRTRARGSARSSQKRNAGVQGAVSRRPRPPRRADPLGGVGRRAHRRGRSRSRPASPTSARPAPGCGRTSTRWRSRTSPSSGATRSASGASTATRFAALEGKQPNGAHRALAELEAAAGSTRWSRRTSTACTPRPARAT